MTAAAPPATTRLNKRMADLGLCSRREADEWIARGWVRVDGQVAPMGLQVGPQARIAIDPNARGCWGGGARARSDIDPKARGQQRERVPILRQKPVGYVSGQAEEGYEPA